MSLKPEVLDALLAAGATAEMIVAAVKADARQEELRLRDKRAADAARQRKSRMSRNVTVTPRDSADMPPNDIYSNPPEPCEANASQPPFAEKLVLEWNAGPAANGARRATKLDASRRTLLKARLREHTEADILAAVANLAASPFHCGEKGWRANLGWFLKAENFIKAVEMGDNAAPAKATVTDQAAYLANLNAKPWANNTRQAEPQPRRGNTGPPRAIGELLPLAGVGR